MTDTGITLTVQIDTSRTPEQQGEECRRAYENDSESQGRCPVCGGLNPGNSSHVRCM